MKGPASLSRRAGSCFIHEPMIFSVVPSGLARSDGMGYCSAVSTRFTPFFKGHLDSVYEYALHVTLKALI